MCMGRRTPQTLGLLGRNSWHSIDAYARTPSSQQFHACMLGHPTPRPPHLQLRQVRPPQVPDGFGHIALGDVQLCQDGGRQLQARLQGLGHDGGGPCLLKLQTCTGQVGGGPWDA